MGHAKHIENIANIEHTHNTTTNKLYIQHIIKPVNNKDYQQPINIDLNI